MKIVSVSAQAWDVPMRAPYRSAQRITTTAHNVLVTVTLEDGSLGYGEAAPATYVTGETQESVLALAQKAQGFVGRDAEETALLLQGKRKEKQPHWQPPWKLTLEIDMDKAMPQSPKSPGAVGAFEMALLDAWARAKNVPLYRVLADKAAEQHDFQTDLSLPILSPEDAEARAIQAAKDGFRALKIKVGCGDLDEDTRRVRAVAEGAPHATLRLDGNQGFSGEEAVRFFDGLSDLHARIEMLEQPTKAGDDAQMKFVAERVPCPVFADESVHDADDARRLLETGTCGGVVLKLAKMGITGAITVGTATRNAGGICLFGCMMETRVATTAALHATLALGSETVPLLDLDGHLLVRDDELVQGGLIQNGDILSVNPALSGMGLTAHTEARVL